MGFITLKKKKKVKCIRVSTLFKHRSFLWEVVKQKNARVQLEEEI